MRIEYKHGKLTGHARKAIIVEDDAVLGKMVYKLLTNRDYQVKLVTSAEEALALLGEEFYPLLLVDLMLPGMSGIDLCRQVRQLSLGRFVSILVMTARTSPEDQELVLEAGADDYVAKPFGMRLFDVRLSVMERRVEDRIARRLADAELDYHRTDLEGLFRSFPEIVYRIDENGRFTYLNDAVTFIGYKPEDLIGKHFSVLLHPEDAERVSRDKVLPQYEGKSTGNGEAPKLFDERRRDRRATRGLDVRLITRGGTMRDGELQPIGEVTSCGLHDTSLDGPEVRFAGSVGVIREVTSRKLMEHDLHFTRFTVDHAAMEVYWVDRNGNLIYVNNQACIGLGYSREELLTMKVWDFDTNVEEDPWPELWKDVFARGGHTFETVSRCKDGSMTPRQVTSQPLSFRGRDVICAFALDISRHKEMEEALERINQALLTLGSDFRDNVNRLASLCGELVGADCALYNRLEEGQLCSIGRWHVPGDFPESDDPSGHICYAIIQGEEDTVRLVRNLPETAFAETDGSVRRYGLKTYMGKAIRCGSEHVGSLCAVWTENVEPTNTQKRIMGIIGSAMGSEEERHRAEEEVAWNLRVSEALGELSRIMLAGPEVSLEEVTVRVQDVACDLTGSNRCLACYLDPVSGRLACPTAGDVPSPPGESSFAGISLDRLWDVIRDRNTPLVARSVDDLKQNGLERSGAENESGCLLASSASLAGKPSGMVVVSRAAGEYSSRHASAVARLGQLYALFLGRVWSEQALVRSERLATAGVLASGVAHEFNNVNTGVLGYSELLLADPGVDGPVRDKVERIRRAATRAQEITGRMLAMTSPDALRRERRSLSDLACDTLAWVSDMLDDRGITLVTDLPEVPEVLLSRGEVGQALLHLIINAEHALLERPKPTITVRTGHDGLRVFISVTDNGCGIPAHNRESIFLPFFSRKGEHAPSGSPQMALKGAGLGLSVTEAIVRAHGGQVAVTSEEGQGSTFTMYFPLETVD